MNKNLEKKLIDKFPTYFRDVYKPYTCMRYGADVGDGWYALIDNMCEDISRTIHGEFVFRQIKEKLGLLCVYYQCEEKYNDVVQKIVDEHSKLSERVCETCGTIDNVTKEGYPRIVTLCKGCRK